MDAIDWKIFYGEERIKLEMYRFHMARTEFHNLVTRPFRELLAGIVPTFMHDEHRRRIKQLEDAFISMYKHQNPIFAHIVEDEKK